MKATSSMSNTSARMLRQFSDEIIELVERVVLSTAIVKGQTHDLEEGSGSAFLYDVEHLVTNNHIIEGLAEPIYVQLPGALQTEARYRSHLHRGRGSGPPRIDASYPRPGCARATGE